MIRVGECAWLLELAQSAHPGDAVLAAQRALEALADPAIVDLVPGAGTVLVIGDATRHLDPGPFTRIEQEARAGRPAAIDATRERVHEIAVRYDGADLAEIAAATGLTVDDVVRRHAGALYRVAFVGFQPGFAYLAGLARELQVPRRATPRPRVPAGSVAIGGEWTGVYPLATPGGWNLLGTTEVALFDARRDPPALLQPGDAVRFVAR